MTAPTWSAKSCSISRWWGWKFSGWLMRFTLSTPTQRSPTLRGSDRAEVMFRWSFRWPPNAPMFASESSWTASPRWATQPAMPSPSRRGALRANSASSP